MKVQVKEIPVRYNGKRYREGDTLKIMSEYFNENLFAELEDDSVDLSELSKEELEKVTNADIKEYLDENEIKYGSRASKDELIALIIGEEDNDEDDEEAGESDEEGTGEEQ